VLDCWSCIGGWAITKNLVRQINTFGFFLTAAAINVPSPSEDLTAGQEMHQYPYNKEYKLLLIDTIELSVKSSKESTEPVSLLKIGNKVVEVG
jgi:hypothetical protein